MRTLSACGLIGLVGLSPAVAGAQTRPPWLPTGTLAAFGDQAPGGVQAPAQAPAPPVLPEPLLGLLDFGARGSSVKGDRARYERYRDLGNGLFLEVFRWRVQPSGWFVDVAADHVGRKDQRYAADFVRPGKLDAWALWDQIPMWMSARTQTLFTVDPPSAYGDVFRIADQIQRDVQASSSALPAYVNSAPTFDLESRRHIGQGGVRYKASPDLTLHATVQSINREGEVVVGGSFGHSVLVEMPAPIRHTTVDVDAGAEFERGRLLVRGGYTGSFFHNDVTSLEFDNPFRAPPDVSGTSSHGRLALAPSNSFIAVNGLASVSMPARTRVTAAFTLGSLQSASDTDILPHTVNAALPVVPVARATVDGEASTSSVNLRLTSRPASGLDFNVQYRMYDYDNRTPELVITQRVAYDNTVSTLTTPKHTEPFGVLRHTFDADTRLTPGAATAVGIGYSHLLEERTHRIFESTSEDILRVIFDVPSHPLFSLRTKYEYGQKRGKGDAADIAAELLAVGEQPSMRHFDIASRDRNRVTLLGSVVATSTLSLTASAAFGKDDYKESHFGLRDNSHRVYSVGLDAVPTDRVSYGGSYEHERYKALSASRQASSGAEFIDPRRDWQTDANDTVHSIVLNARVLKLRETIDVDFSYDYNRARATYKYITGPVSNPTLPEVPDVPSTLPPPSQLPPVKSDLQRAVFNVTYHLGPKIGIGLSYWFEDYYVEDFTLDQQANPQLARGQTLLLGYLYEPYTAHTVWGRVFYRW